MFAITITALLALIVGVLAVPLVIMVDAEFVDRWRVRWRVRWLFGLVDVRLGREPRESPASTTVRRQTRRVGKQRGRRLRIGLAVLTARGFIRRVADLISSLLRQVRLERFHLDAAVGFEDPVNTGIAYGCLSPLLMLAHARGLDVRYTPMFVEPGIIGDWQMTVRVRPMSIARSVVAFLVSPAAVRALAAAWRARR